MLQGTPGVFLHFRPHPCSLQTRFSRWLGVVSGVVAAAVRAGTGLARTDEVNMRVAARAVMRNLMRAILVVFCVEVVDSDLKVVRD